MKLDYIKTKIKEFDLDLSGLTVYTELGSKNYKYTCICAALANAKKVYAISQDSIFGTFEDNLRNLNATCYIPSIRSRIEVVDSKKKEHLQEADIITNSGFVRPLDRATLSMMKPTAVIPLMYETWEFRDADIDFNFCKENDIMVLGVNEECAPMDMMRYSGFLVSKLMFECGLGVHKDKILIIGSGRIGNNLANFMHINGINFKWISLDNNISKIEDIKNELADFDAIIVAEHYHNTEIIGASGLIHTKDLNPLVQLIHICGNVDMDSIKEYGLQIYPNPVMSFGYMTASADYLDAKATIELNIAGLKVGEIMARNRLKYDFNKAYIETIKYPLVNKFEND